MTILIRDVLEQDGLSYSQAAHMLQTTPQIATGYFMIAGMRPGEGMVITRNRKNTADVWTVDKPKGRWYILETNFDHWGTPGDKRRETGERMMNETGPNFTAKDLYNVLSVSPVKNSATVFTSIMSPSHPEMMKEYSKIRYPTPSKKSRKEKQHKLKRLTKKLRKFFKWFRPD